MTYPTIAVELSFGADRFDTPSYTTLPAEDVKAFTIKTGRESELDGSNPGTLAATLYNDTREYDPTNTSGSHYGDLVPGVKTRVTATIVGITFELFNGWTDGWPQDYDLRTGVATLNASGGFRFLARSKITDPYAAAIAAETDLVAWYRMSDSDAHSLTDASGSGLHGRWAPEFTEIRTVDGLIASDDGATDLPAAPSVGVGKIPAAAIPTLRPLSIEMWIKIDKVPKPLEDPLDFFAHLLSILVIGSAQVRIYSTDGDYPGALEFIIIDDPDIGSANIAQATTVYDTGAGIVSYSVCDGRTHHVVCTINAAGSILYIYIDGVDRAPYNDFTGGAVSPIQSWTDIDINGIAGWDGSAVIDELAFYDAELSESQAAAHYAAGSNPGVGDHTGERVGRVLDLIDWPAGLRDLDAGQTLLGVATGMAGEPALDYLDLLATTEQGRLAEAHHDSGKILFQDRAGRLTDSRSATIQTTFSDSPGDLAAAAVPYSNISLATDDRPAANVVTVAWRGGDVEARSQSSIDAYGEILYSATTLLESRVEAENLAQWILNEQATLFTRVQSVTIRPAGMIGLTSLVAWSACLGAREGDRVRVKHTPVSTGTQIDQQLWVIGIEHRADGIEWETVLYLAPAIMTSYWILGTSELGTGTRLAY